MKKTVTYTIDRTEINNILIAYFKEKGIDVSMIQFITKPYLMGGGASVDGVTVTAKEEIKS